MATNIQIRNVPEGIHRELRVRAAECGVSLSDYLLSEVIEVARRPRIADVLRKAELREDSLSISAIVEALHADRAGH